MRRQRIELPVLASRNSLLYEQICRHIEQAIAAGELHPGDALPSERDLARATNVSRVTVRRAVQKLVETGLLVNRRGAGTFVSGLIPRVERSMTKLLSLSEEMLAQGLQVTSIWLQRNIEAPNVDEARLFGLFTHDRVVRLSRLRCVRSTPVAIERSTIPTRFIPDPSVVDTSLYASLQAADASPFRAHQRLRAISLEAVDADLLGVEPGAAAMEADRTTYLENGAPLERTVSLYRAETYDFVSELEFVTDREPGSHRPHTKATSDSFGVAP